MKLSRGCKRFWSLLGMIAGVSIFLFYILLNLQDNIEFFVKPSELGKVINREKVRVGGFVKDGSAQSHNGKTFFIITDYQNEINVEYIGRKPNLFAENQPIIAVGKINDQNDLIAHQLIASHDETYKAKEE